MKARKFMRKERQRMRKIENENIAGLKVNVCNYYNDMAKKFKLDLKINLLMLMRDRSK